MYQINHDTFKELWDENFQFLVYLSYNQGVKKLEVAQDLVSETFISIWNKKPEFNSKKHAKKYLYAAAFHRRINYLKWLKPTHELNFDIEEETAHQIEAEVISAIHKEIEKLPTVCKAVFKKRAIERKTFANICADLNIKPATAFTHYQRAKILLRKRLQYAMG